MATPLFVTKVGIVFSVGSDPGDSQNPLNPDLSTLEVIDLSIKAGVDVDLCDDPGETPFMNPVHAALLDHARQLLAYGANVTALTTEWVAMHPYILPYSRVSPT